MSTLELNPNKTDGNLFSIPEHKEARSQHSRCMTCTFKYNLCDLTWVTGPFIYKNKNLWKTFNAPFINKWCVWHILISSKSFLLFVHEKQVGFFISSPLNDFCYMKVFQVNRCGIFAHNGLVNVVRATVAYHYAGRRSSYVLSFHRQGQRRLVFGKCSENKVTAYSVCVCVCGGEYEHALQNKTKQRMKRNTSRIFAQDKTSWTVCVKATVVCRLQPFESSSHSP